MSPSNFPNVAQVLPSWFQTLTFGVVVKTVVNFNVVETETDVSFFGVFQPFSTRKLMLLPEGQRSWSWFEVHSKTNLHLENDDIIKFKSMQYRVMAQNDYSLNGYFYYEIVEDYTGSGPTVV